MEHEVSGGVCLNHVRVCPIVSAQRKAARWSVGCPGGANLAGIVLDVRGGGETAIGKNWQHRDSASEIVSHQHEPSRRMDAHKGGTGASGTNGIKQLQVPVISMDGEGTDR